MKLKKILATLSAAAIAATVVAIPASAGKGAPIGVPTDDGWILEQKGVLAKKMVIGSDDDKPCFPNVQASWDKILKAKTVRLTISGGYFFDDDGFEDGWNASGAVVVGCSQNGWMKA
ncbi:MAG: hypothetical protein ACI4RN_00660, partial [Oscillospiraceae bacterium]